METTNLPNINIKLQHQPDLSVPTKKNIEDIINGIQQNDKSVYEPALINFLVKEYGTFNIEELQDENLRNQLWNSVIQLASNSQDNVLLAEIFIVLRIITRCKNSVNQLANEELLNLIMLHAGLNDETYNYDESTLCKIEEVSKVLWNILFSSKEQIEASISNGLLERIMNRIKLYNNQPISDMIKYYDVKFIFLLSAMSPPVREKLRNDLNGLRILTDALQVILKEAAESVAQPIELPAVLDDSKADIACEVLKALFNITLKSYDTQPYIEKYTELVILLRSYLLAATITLDKTWELRNCIVNLLTNLPPSCYMELVTPLDKTKLLPKMLKYEDYNMIVIYQILMFLEGKFNDICPIDTELEIFSPILSFLLKAAIAHRVIRKFLRLHILPPLKEFDTRPEESDTLRGHLCKLLTTPITQVRDLVAELLFVLCKCNVSRMIKYTGYGNAAGLFARKGLLGGKKDEAAANFSSDDEDSETEEYSEQKHLINPVLGCVEPPHSNPLADMTDEQKEYEAMKLVDLMNSLTKTGAIKPCRVGEDGKPHPIEHILELQDGVQIKEDDSDSESD